MRSLLLAAALWATPLAAHAIDVLPIPYEPPPPQKTSRPAAHANAARYRATVSDYYRDCTMMLVDELAADPRLSTAGFGCGRTMAEWLEAQGIEPTFEKVKCAARLIFLPGDPNTLVSDVLDENFAAKCSA